jgi:hypothetical protein
MPLTFYDATAAVKEQQAQPSLPMDFAPAK